MSLKITNLFKRYYDSWILKDISIEVEEGEILGIFGTTGSGKSTLIRVIAGIEKADSGIIRNHSKDVTNLSCEDRKFHFPNLTNESYWKSLFKTNKNSELADGEGQILALEDALTRSSGVLLLDNSFCNMDRIAQIESYKKLRQTAREKNLSVIFATNDYEEIFSLCDRVSILVNGEIKQTGTPREVYEKPNSATVARILGRNNLIPARRLTSGTSEIPEFQTVSGEHRLFTNKSDRHLLGAINQNIILAIRPEHISISFGASFPEDNILKATIIGVKFLGATTLLELDANGLLLEAMVLRLVGLNIGDECIVGLPPDRILIFKD